jgi:hypothetical protein
MKVSNSRAVELVRTAVTSYTMFVPDILDVKSRRHYVGHPKFDRSDKRWALHREESLVQLVATDRSYPWVQTAFH